MATAPAHRRDPRLERPGGTRPLPSHRQPRRLSARNAYSLFVGWMKVLLPALACGLVILVVAWPHLVPEDELFGQLDFDTIVKEADSLSMVNARFSGVDENQQPFNLLAARATQTSQASEEIVLESPQADITLQDGSWITITANSGNYDRGAEQLSLDGAVNLFHDDGMEMRTELARVDLKESLAWGDQRVEGQGPAGTIESEGFQVFDKGAIIVFTGKSKAVLYPGASTE